jgi:exosome complex component RRP4
MITKEKEQEMEEGMEEEQVEGKEKRELVIPGEVIATGKDYLPGEWTQREGQDIVSLRFGLADRSGRLAKIIPLSGTYMPRKGNVVIGKVVDITFNGWLMDVDAHYPSFLPLTECSKFVNKNDLSECYDIGDMVAVKIQFVKRKGIDLTARGKNLGKLEEGLIIRINSNKVPRVIGKEGSMINLIKTESNCDITVGQNGIIWIRGRNIEDELFAEKAIMFVTEKSFVEGLTDKTKEWLEQNKKKSPKKEEEIKEQE